MSKILYAAGTMEHIRSFHLPYIDALRRDGNEVLTMARGKDADFDISFVKKMFSLKNLACQRKIKKILKAEKFDAIILNTTLAAFNIRAALPRRNRPKVINFVHGYMFPAEIKSLKDKIFLFSEKLFISEIQASFTFVAPMLPPKDTSSRLLPYIPSLERAVCFEVALNPRRSGFPTTEMRLAFLR